MNAKMSDLILILEEELSVGAQLGANLLAQKNALVAWDVVDLVGQIEAREQWVRRLAELEERRNQILAELNPEAKSITLRQLIAALPEESAEKSRLFGFRERARNTFFQLQAEEQYLQSLMKNLLAHVQEALQPLGRPQAPTYGESGSAEAHRPESSLLRSQA